MPTTYAIPDGRTVMAATTYTGTGAVQSISNAVNGVSMQPDWVWFKRRGAVENHWLTDSVRGSTKGLFSNLTDAEATRTDQLTSFNSNGFSLGADAAGYSNVSGQSYVAWQWKAGGTAVSNTAGSITSSVSANTTAGFSVVTYTGNLTAGQSVGHGLGVALSMIIVKARSNAIYPWDVYHGSLAANQYLELNATTGVQTSANIWANTAPTSTVFSIGADLGTNKSGDTYVAYCFAPVTGYSAFGSYTGNGSTDGPFVFTGFRPRYVMIKGSSFTSNWFVIDTSRSSYNVSLDALRPNLSAAETSTGTYSIDILSNGFKLRTSAADSNTSGATFIYACFGENPFKFANAR